MGLGMMALEAAESTQERFNRTHAELRNRSARQHRDEAMIKLGHAATLMEEARTEILQAFIHLDATDPMLDPIKEVFCSLSDDPNSGSTGKAFDFPSLIRGLAQDWQPAKFSLERDSDRGDDD
jgi:hypothetical protein